MSVALPPVVYPASGQDDRHVVALETGTAARREISDGGSY